MGLRRSGDDHRLDRVVGEHLVEVAGALTSMWRAGKRPQLLGVAVAQRLQVELGGSARLRARFGPQ